MVLIVIKCDGIMSNVKKGDIKPSLVVSIEKRVIITDRQGPNGASEMRKKLYIYTHMDIDLDFSFLFLI
jgi:hypothetical protein